MVAASSSAQMRARSISLPSRLHPNSQKIEAELNKLKTWESSFTTREAPLGSEALQSGLNDLAALYNSTKEVIVQAPLAQQALLQHQSRKVIEETLDASIGLLDACGSARDMLLKMKEHVQALQSALRRRIGDVNIETSVHSYICFRKKAKKERAKSLRALKTVQSRVPTIDLLLSDHISLMVMKVLGELISITISIFRSLFVFSSAPLTKTKGNGWLLISKLMPITFAASEKSQKMLNQVGTVDVSVLSLQGQLKKNDAKSSDVEMVKTRLRTLDCCIDGLEGGLNYMFRSLIQHRVSLLNLITP
ncbi:hypothetical protein UlMin_039664 [Ulmus minor]